MVLGNSGVLMKFSIVSVFVTVSIFLFVMFFSGFTIFFSKNIFDIDRSMKFGEFDEVFDFLTDNIQGGYKTIDREDSWRYLQTLGIFYRNKNGIQELVNENCDDFGVCFDYLGGAAHIFAMPEHDVQLEGVRWDVEIGGNDYLRGWLLWADIDGKQRVPFLIDTGTSWTELTRTTFNNIDNNSDRKPLYSIETISSERGSGGTDYYTSSMVLETGELKIENFSPFVNKGRSTDEISILGLDMLMSFENVLVRRSGLTVNLSKAIKYKVFENLERRVRFFYSKGFIYIVASSQNDDFYNLIVDTGSAFSLVDPAIKEMTLMVGEKIIDFRGEMSVDAINSFVDDGTVFHGRIGVEFFSGSESFYIDFENRYIYY